VCFHVDVISHSRKARSQGRFQRYNKFTGRKAMIETKVPTNANRRRLARDIGLANTQQLIRELLTPLDKCSQFRYIRFTPQLLGIFQDLAHAREAFAGSVSRR